MNLKSWRTILRKTLLKNLYALTTHQLLPQFYLSRNYQAVYIYVLIDITVKNHYLLSLIKETFKHLFQAKYFTKLDVIAAFNKLRFKEEKEWKSAFLTHYEFYEYLVMLFGFYSVSAKFQSYINKTLQNYFNVFVFVYMNDILIYSNTLKKYKQYVYQVLKQLQNADLQIDIAKCEFYKEEVLYLSLIVERNRICMNSRKIATIQLWLHPQNKKNV